MLRGDFHLKYSNFLEVSFAIKNNMPYSFRSQIKVKSKPFLYKPAATSSRKGSYEHLCTAEKQANSVSGSIQDKGDL
jgi:hypothetical protein